MLQGFTGWHFLLLLVVLLLLFGAPKLPQLARSLGQSMRIFRGEVDQMKQERKPAEGATDALQAGVEPSATAAGQTTAARSATESVEGTAGDTRA